MYITLQYNDDPHCYTYNTLSDNALHCRRPMRFGWARRQSSRTAGRCVGVVAIEINAPFALPKELHHPKGQNAVTMCELPRLAHWSSGGRHERDRVEQVTAAHRHCESWRDHKTSYCSVRLGIDDRSVAHRTRPTVGPLSSGLSNGGIHHR